MTTKYILLSIVLFIVTTIIRAQSPNKLNNPYGICAHVSRYTDFGLRYDEINLIKEIGIGNLRTDFDWVTLGEKNDYTKFDSIVDLCQRYNIQLLPILSRSTKDNYAWNDMNAYKDYVSKIVERYHEKLKYWEYMNEPDLIKNHGSAANIADKYCITLSEMQQLINSYECKMLMCSQAELKNGFFASMLKNKAFDNVDILNLHYYTNYFTPEYAINEYYKTFNDSLNKYNIKKPLWVTETGYHTESDRNSNNTYWREIVPQALKMLGINSDAQIAIVCDYDKQVYGAVENDVAQLNEANYKNIKYIALNELAQLNPSITPVLIPMRGESFPEKQCDDLLRYVRNGGTIILSQGLPFYYKIDKNGKSIEYGEQFAKQFHIGYIVSWSEEGKKLGVSDIPSNFSVNEKFSQNYNCIYSSSNTARYVSTKYLKDGDKFIEIATAGDKYKGNVAGIFDFNSDLSGNIIFQTRFDKAKNITEDLQARRLVRSFIIAFAKGAEKVFWYHLRAFETDKYESEDNFGITHKDLKNVKPALNAYKALIKMLPDQSTRPNLNVENDIYTSTWIRPDKKQVTAYWTSFGEKTIKIKRRTKVFDFMGNEVKAKKHYINISNGVTFVIKK